MRFIFALFDDKLKYDLKLLKRIWLKKNLHRLMCLDMQKLVITSQNTKKNKTFALKK